MPFVIQMRTTYYLPGATRFYGEDGWSTSFFHAKRYEDRDEASRTCRRNGASWFCNYNDAEVIDVKDVDVGCLLGSVGTGLRDLSESKRLDFFDRLLDDDAIKGLLKNRGMRMRLEQLLEDAKAEAVR